MQIIERAIKVPARDETTKQKTTAFWHERCFQIKQRSPSKLTEKRGSTIGNSISLDMRKLNTVTDTQLLPLITILALNMQPVQGIAYIYVR